MRTCAEFYAYLLRRRGIDHDVLNTFVYKGMIYESADYHNAVFVGFDPEGKPRHVHKRSTGSESSFKGNQDGSTPEYSFHWRGTDNQLTSVRGAHRYALLYLPAQGGVAAAQLWPHPAACPIW